MYHYLYLYVYVCVLYLLDMIYVIIARKLMWSSIINEFSCGE